MDTRNLKSFFWGLFKKDSKQAIPLKSLDISIKIIHNTARVFYSQIYYNDADTLIETEFFFPISPDACFDSFEAAFNNTTIKGVVKEKEKAQEEYKEAVEQGKTAAYSEINQETGDIMKVQIGNIPPKTDIKITYSYIQKLETSLNKFWCFRLCSTITPRYNGDLTELMKHDVSLLASYPIVSKDSKNAYPWKVEVEIQSPSPITFLKSPSHDIITNYGNENHTCNISFNPEVKYFPNKDFILLYSNGKENKVDYTLTPFEDGYCAMVSLLADFDKLSDTEAFENFAKAKPVSNSHTMTTVRGEYIFLIDRSGSMTGDRITMAKESVILFLKSLPKDAFFNVISFGSGFRLLNQSSLEYSQKNIDDSIKQIKSFNADMGGTEIFVPLKAIFNTPEKKGYPRSVFLLTDGAVSNTKNVLELIKENSDRTRVFTIGIGNGCSPLLITKGAEYGKGKAEFVSEIDDIYEKIISLLNASLSPCYFDISLQGANFDAVVKSVSPNPTSLSYLLNGQTLTIFLMLREAAFSDDQKWKLQLRLYDSRVQDYRTVEIVLDTADTLKNELIPKLAISDMIKRLENQKDMMSKEDSDILWMEKEDLKQTMVEYSIKYGILCKETAFFCVVDNENENKQYLSADKIVIPAISSEDYSGIHGQLQSVQNVMNQSLAQILTRGEKLDMLMDKSQDLSAASNMFYKKAKSSNSVLGNIVGGISGAFSSLFGAKKKMMVLPPTSSKRMFVPQQDLRCMDDNDVNDCMDDYDDGFSAEEEQKKSAGKKEKTSAKLYLEVIMGQKLEGFWEPTDQNVKQKVLKKDELPLIPTEVKIDNSSLVKTIWFTILVLVWLETVCNEHQKAWTLVHQKGCEWLKAQGVDYEQVKEFGAQVLKV